MTIKELVFEDLHITEREVWRQMGYGETTPDDRVAKTTRQIIREVSPMVHPRFGYTVVSGELLSNLLRVDNQTLHVGKTIATQLKKSEAFALFVATVGREFEQFQQKVSGSDDILHAFITDALGSVMAEHCADQLENHLQTSIDKLGWRHTNRFSPGYCHWPITDQPTLFALLGEASCGVTLNESCLMSPIKSVSGIIGVGSQVEHKDYACAFCNKADCMFRKRPTP